MDWYCSATHVLFIPGGYTAELQQADIASSRLWSTASNRRPCNSLPSPCARTMRCLTCASAPWSVSWRTGFCMPPQRCRKARASQRKPGATSLGHSKRHQGLRREPLASTTMAHSSMRRRWNKRSHRRRKRTSSSMTTAMTDAEDPESTVTAARPSNKNLEGNTGLQQFSSKPPRGILVGCASRLERRPYASTQT